MNHIGQSSIPTLPVSTNPNPPGTPDRELPDDGEKFDSVLQQRTEQPDEEVSTTEPAIPVEARAPIATPADNPDAAAQAGLIVLFTPPPIVPLPEPVSASQPETIAANPAEKEDGTTMREIVPAFSGQPVFQQGPTDISRASLPTSEPLPQPMPQVPAPKGDSKFPLSESTAQPLEVANVLGIIPPVQSPAAQSAETIVRSATPVIPSKIRPTIIGEPAFIAVPGTASSAISATQNEQSLPVEIVAPVPRSAESTPVPVPINALSMPEMISGTTAAKPGSVMSAPTLQRPQRSTSATPAEVVSHAVAPVAVPNDGTQTLRNTPVLAPMETREHSANGHSENMEPPAMSASDIASASFSIEPLRPTAANDVSAPIRAADVAQVMTHTLQATEKLRVSGQERVELALKLDNGQELTIQLRLANGQVTPIIRTDSEPLRIALEQNWSRFLQNGGDRELRITTPVFESPQTSSNMSDPNHQRNERERAFNEPAPEYSQQTPPPRRNTAPLTTRPPAFTDTLSAGVRLYA